MAAVGEWAMGSGRVVARLAAAALFTATLATMPAPPAGGQDSCPEAAFTDRAAIPAAHVGNVDCAVHAGIVSGYADDTYRPAASVRRDQMAAFLARTLDAAGVALPDGSTDRFNDIDDNPHARDINRLAEAGVVAGRTERSFAPAGLVRRDQTASFLLRAAAYGLGRPLSHLQSDRQVFSDVAPRNVHFRNVNGAAKHDLISGRNGRYRPAADTRRDQMASLVVRLLRYVRGGGEAPPPPPSSSVGFTTETVEVGVELWSAAIGDVTGDGRNDVLLTSGDGTDELASSLFLMVGRADGSLGSLRRFDLSGKGVCCNARQMGIAIGNIRGGARNEVAVATARGIDVLQWDGSGLVRLDRLAVSGIVQHVRVTDLNGDGDTDIVVRMGNRDAVDGGVVGGVVALVRSGQGFVERRLIEVSHYWQGALEVADLNGDGRPDVAMTHNELVVAMQKPGGTFAVTATPLRRFAKGFTFADVTGDRRPDAVVTYDQNSPTTIEVLPNDGAGRFGAPQHHETFQLPSAVKSADLNGTGRPDIAVMHSGSYSRLGTYLQQDSGLADERLHELPEYNATHHHSDAMAVGDVTGDGRPDLVAADGHRILIMRNR